MQCDNLKPNLQFDFEDVIQEPLLLKQTITLGATRRLSRTTENSGNRRPWDKQGEVNVSKSIFAF